MRRHAEELGVSITEMQSLAEEEDIDYRIDRSVSETPASSTSRYLIDARMGWAFSPMCLSVQVRCSPEIAGARVYAATRQSETYASAEEATAALLARQQAEVERYRRLYGGISYTDDVFDIVIDTAGLTPEESADIIERAALAMEGESRNGTIGTFREEHYWLSNMYETAVEFEGLRYGSSEAAYQAQKFLDPAIREQMSRLDGKSAKKLAATLQCREGWLGMRRSVMERVVMAKFSQNEELRRKLVCDTEGFWLEEGNTWGDAYFGVVTSEVTGRPFGANVLGRTLMKVRRELSGRPSLGA
jgi:ribA/ribD-fused uncharacterized protein